MKIEIRPQKVSDAKRFFSILSNHNFDYYPVNVKTPDEEINFLRQNAKREIIEKSSIFQLSVMGS